MNVFLCVRAFIFIGIIVYSFLYHLSPSPDSENGPWGKKFAAKCKGNASCKVEGVQIWSEQLEKGIQKANIT